MIISGIAHIAVLVLFIFLVAWRAPNPPHPEIGIELNFGTSAEGTGDTQPEPFTPAVDTDSEEDAPEAEDEPVTEVTEEVTEETTEPVEATVQEVVETAEQAEVKPVTEQPTEAPVKEPEVKEEAKKEEAKEVVKEEPKELPKVLYPGTKDGKADEAKNANQGDKTDAEGDQGDKEGTVDSRALYGTPGGGDGGASLNMTGWRWDRIPDPKEKSSEDGKVVIKVTIDNRGEVTSAEVVAGTTVTRTTANKYRDEVSKLTFSKTNPGATPEAQTVGYVTFVLTAQ